MPLSLDNIAFLQSDRAHEQLESLASADLSDANILPLLSRLRRSFTARQAAALLTTLRLRKAAKTKFPEHGERMLFTDAGLQQASGPLLRLYRARQFESRRLLDLCCGIGADSLAFAAADREVHGLDIDPVRIAIARHNASLLRLPARFSVCDIRAGIPSAYDAIFFDPARRDSQDRRIQHVEAYIPPLSLARKWRAREIAVKLSPGVDLRQVAEYGGSLEFISAQGRLSEALLWLHRDFAQPVATLLRGADALRLRDDGAQGIAVTAPRAWLLEPDPAVLRAGLVQTLARQLGASMLDASIAYLTSDQPVQTAWARSWKIREWLPFQLKRLRRHLQARGIGRVTVKKRGFAMQPDELIARLRLSGEGDACVLVMTRCRGKAIAILCDEAKLGQFPRNSL
ncbi:MAG: methyltransferase domain-containing protein [Chloroflexota bacterium]|nr:methyltransferase domain-containing protein [Chloroflexota bacterium]MCY3583095.1 methyltransferase domain-containing protein [Chloroflexota bacterium]MDE2650703.1 methyltransferase domain-containing protein [Chloroflexota bacterium]MXV92584.1 class I SAM-dependent methyltransferase [Chloroflexota bacterium]MXX49788.1 class I SAM-dependent methyltransferase [Chloroflexota bacterium]